MKNIAVLIVGLSFAATAFAQEPYNIPSDMDQVPYNVDEMITVIDDAVNTPTQENNYVTSWLSGVNYPVSEPNLVARKQWIAKNQAAVTELLIARKKNHDKLNPQN